MSASELDTDLAAFEGRLREAYVRTPAPAVAEEHVAAMVAEAEASAITAPLDAAAIPSKRTRPSRWVVARRLAIAPLAVLVAGAGMAVAGVRPPEPISDLFEEVGIDVPGSERASDEGGDRKAPADRSEPGGADGSGTGIGAGDGSGNPSNDGATPGARDANENAAEGQETAEQARSGETPPDTPGQSGDHPAPQGNGTPPEDPGHPGPGKPDSPPGQSQSSAQDHGGGTANKPQKPEKDKLEKQSSG